jgi:hypothetical protein
MMVWFLNRLQNFMHGTQYRISDVCYTICHSGNPTNLPPVYTTGTNHVIPWNRNSRGGCTKSQKVPPHSPPLMNQLQHIVTVNPWRISFFTELTTEAQTVQVREEWKNSLTPSSTNCQLRSFGVNSQMMTSGNVFGCYPKRPVYRWIFCRKKVMVQTSLPHTSICEGCQLVLGICWQWT